ncbi:unnamed protein product [Notodromas monacha]|uniref:Secreted protein n=1 Tax=Notodromas monacha TaxID=399045 RepID=A0A7R9BPB6_9CRUS|nr:unnamed protein product [Notodromas monacha]CAG0918326.1 unnamed protein product [Notodromas monacha]
MNSKQIIGYILLTLTAIILSFDLVQAQRFRSRDNGRDLTFAGDLQAPPGIGRDGRDTGRLRHRIDKTVDDFRHGPTGNYHLFTTPIKYRVFGNAPSGRWYTRARSLGPLGR